MAKKKNEELPTLEMAPPGLAGSKATELEIVRWVARSIDDRDVKPANCPDPFAWTLLRLCRADAEFSVSFIEKLWSKLIPSRSQLETGSLKDLDGKVTIELIEKIQAMRGDAIGDEEQEPEPAPKVPSYFDEFNPGESE